jgi:hypothetical protein
MIQFVLISFRPDLPVYGGVKGQFTFVISLIEGRFHATAKQIGAKKFDGTRVELGYYRHFQDAQDACEKYFLKHSQ